VSCRGRFDGLGEVAEFALDRACDQPVEYPPEVRDVRFVGDAQSEDGPAVGRSDVRDRVEGFIGLDVGAFDPAVAAVTGGFASGARARDRASDGFRRSVDPVLEAGPTRQRATSAAAGGSC
jgi:hypothetical protein